MFYGAILASGGFVVRVTYAVEHRGYNGLCLFIQKPKELTWPLAHIRTVSYFINIILYSAVGFVMKDLYEF